VRLCPLALCILLSLTFTAEARTSRSAAEVLAFKRANPCPDTGSTSGPCKGWQIDHVFPLCAGGADKLENLQWLTIQDHKRKTRDDLRVCRYLRRVRVD
jgi:hypothetical protein